MYIVYNVKKKLNGILLVYFENILVMKIYINRSEFKLDLVFLDFFYLFNYYFFLILYIFE